MTEPTCPMCEAPQPVPADSCPSCHGDLRPLLRLADLADWHYNQAVAAAHTRHWSTAAEHLTVTMALRPDDVDALVLLGKVRLHQRRRQRALEIWQRAGELAPDRADIPAAVAAVRATFKRG
jgi:cytochrome c-type biogenesis protein CcmH/NrfG